VHPKPQATKQCFIEKSDWRLTAQELDASKARQQRFYEEIPLQIDS